MPTQVIGLEYISPHEKIETEEELTAVLKDMNKIFTDFQKGFIIKDNENEEITSFKDFIEYAVNKPLGLKSPLITLEGSGNIGGIEIKNGLIQYNLNKARIMNQWNKNRSGACYGCKNIRRYFVAHDETQLFCKYDKIENSYVRNPFSIRKNKDSCSEYDPKAKNSEGKPAKTIEEIILQVII